jgi:hypothetical protein
VSEKRVWSKLSDAQEHLRRRAEGWAGEFLSITAIIQQMLNETPTLLLARSHAGPVLHDEHFIWIDACSRAC